MPHARPGAYLSFLGSDRAECNSCRQFGRIFYKGTSGKAVSDSLVKDAKKRKEHIQAVLQYEQNLEARKNKHSRGVAQMVQAPTLDVVVASAAIQKSELDLGAFWPQEIYNAHFPDSPLTKSQLSTHTHNNRRYPGILRDSCHGCPRGCFKLTDTDQTSVTKKQRVQDNSGACSSADVSATFDKIRGAMCVSVGKKVGKSKDGAETEVLVLKKNSKGSAMDGWASDTEGDGDAGDDDWIGVVNNKWGGLIGKGAKQGSRKRQRSAHSDSSHDGGSSRMRASSTRSLALPKSEKKEPREKKGKAEPPSATKKSEKVIYPSEQQRSLNATRSVRMEANAMLDLAGNSDSIGTLSHQKVVKMRAKLENKLDHTSKRILTYKGASGEDEAHVSLVAEGEAANYAPPPPPTRAVGRIPKGAWAGFETCHGPRIVGKPAGECALAGTHLVRHLVGPDLGVGRVGWAEVGARLGRVLA